MKVLSKVKILTEKDSKFSCGYDIEKYLNENDNGNDIDFEAIRSHFHADKKQLPDGYIHQIAIDNGFDVSD